RTTRRTRRRWSMARRRCCRWCWTTWAARPAEPSADARLRREPRPQPSQRLLHVHRGRGEAEADEAVAIDGVEVHAGGQGHAGVLEDAPAQPEAVVGQVGHVGPDVER